MLKKFLPIILLTFVNVIGFSLLIPVLPSVVEGYVGSERLQGVIYGALIASYSLCQFLAAPALGTLSDKYGRKPVLMLSQLGTTLSWVIFGAAYFIPETRVFGLALPIFIISLSRITDGLTGGNISVAQAWISDMTTKEEKTKTFASIGAVFGIGFLIGPAIGGLAASTSYGYLGTAVVAFIISLFTLIYMQLYLPESLPEDKRDHELRFHLGRELNVIGKLQEFRDNRVVKSLLFIRIFFAIVFASYTTIVTLYLSNEYNLSPTALGLTFSLIGIYSIINQIVVIRPVVKKLGDLNTLYAGILALGLGLLFFPIIASVTNGNNTLGYILIMGNAYLMNLGISLSSPTFKSLLTNSVDEKRQGIITGLDEALLALGQGITPIIAGLSYSLFGTSTFVLFAVLLALPHLIIWLKTGHAKVQTQS